jgi:ribosomal protein L1
MAKTEKAVRKSVSLPARVHKRVAVIASSKKTSANRVLVDLIEAGLQSKEAEKDRFFALANRLTESTDSVERQRIKKELARMTFGE